MIEIECPKCETEFDAVEWDDGNCPKCNNGYTWDEIIIDFGADYWTIVEWEDGKLRQGALHKGDSE